MNKYLSIENRNIYEKNKNGSFTADVEQMIFNKTHKIAISELHYTNKFKINLGFFEITLKNIEGFDLNNHDLMLNGFKKNLTSLVNNIKEFFNNYKEIFLFFELTEAIQKQRIENELKKKEIFKEMKNILTLYTELFNYMIKNKEFSLNYNVLNDQLNVHAGLFNLLESKGIYNRELKNELNEINSNIKNFLTKNKYNFYFRREIIFYDRISIKEFFDFLIRNLPDSINAELFERKIIFKIQHKFTYKLDEKLKRLLNVKIENNIITFNTKKQLAILDKFFIYTDIIESNEVSSNREQLLQIIKTEGEFDETIIKTFSRPQYSTINKTLINTISIKIFDSFKNIVEFEDPFFIRFHIKEK